MTTDSAGSVKQIALDPNIIALDLGNLQAHSKKVDKEINRSRRSLYEHLCASYLWWRKAQTVSGYLESEYGKLNRKFRKVATHPNFIKLIWLIWGEETDLTNQYADRYSRALKAVHAEFEKHQHKYQKDGQKKLVNFILRSGGLSKLAGYTDLSDSKTTGGHGSKQGNSRKVWPSGSNELVSADARFYSECQDQQELSFKTRVHRKKQVYSLSAVNQWHETLAIKLDTNGPTVTDLLLTDYYLHQFDACDTSVRPLFELIQSQCSPLNLEKFSSGATRVIYLKNSDQLLLSPAGSSTGIVCKVTPNIHWLDDCLVDLILPSEQRLFIENEILHTRAFNRYGTSAIENFDIFNNIEFEGRSIKLLDHSNTSNSFCLNLDPFGRGGEVLPQLDLKPDYKFEACWSARVPHEWFLKLSERFLTPWLNSHGKHVSRDSNILIGLHLGKNGADISYYRRAGKFELTEEVLFDGLTQVEGRYRGLFRSQDWVSVMRGICLLPVVGKVLLAVNDDLMKITFRTRGLDGCIHEIYIPTTDGSSKRSTKAFGNYYPVTESEASGARGAEIEESYEVSKEAA